MTKHKVGDLVKPRPECKGIVPSGRIRKVVKWGPGYAYYLEGYAPAYVDGAFEDAADIGQSLDTRP